MSIPHLFRVPAQVLFFQSFKMALVLVGVLSHLLFQPGAVAETPLVSVFSHLLRQAIQRALDDVWRSVGVDDEL